MTTYRQRYPSLFTPTHLGILYIFSRRFLRERKIFWKRKNKGRAALFCTSGTYFPACLPCVVTCLLCSNENFGASLPKVLNVPGKWIAKTLYAVDGQGKRENKNSLTAQASYPTSPLPDISFSDSLTSGEFSFRVRV